MTAKNYRDLIAWQKAMALVRVVYKLTVDLPPSERFGLSAQLRRAAVSIPVNIAEGEGRRAPKEFRHYLSIAHGELREVETEIQIAMELGFISELDARSAIGLAQEVGRLISGLRRHLSNAC